MNSMKTWISYSEISILHEIVPVLEKSNDQLLTSLLGWWMATSLPRGIWPASMLGSCIINNGELYGGHTSSAINLFQRPALDK